MFSSKRENLTSLAGRPYLKILDDYETWTYPLRICYLERMSMDLKMMTQYPVLLLIEDCFYPLLHHLLSFYYQHSRQKNLQV